MEESKKEKENAEEYFGKKIRERISPEDLEKKITGEPSELVKKIFEEQNLTRIMANALFLIYKNEPLNPVQIIKGLSSKEVEFSGEILFQALEKLKKEQLIEGTYAASPEDSSTKPLIEYFLITEKGTKFVQARIKEAEADYMLSEHVEKEVVRE